MKLRILSPPSWSISRNLITWSRKLDISLAGPGEIRDMIVIADGSPDDIVYLILAHKLDGGKAVGITATQEKRVASIPLALELVRREKLEKLLIALDQEADELAELAKDSFGVVFVPALAGIGTPYWINEVRGCVHGLSRGTRREHLVRALMEGLAFRLSEVINVVESVSGMCFSEIVADGNASKHDVLLQLVADLSGKKVIRAKNLEGSSRGAFLLARGAIKGLSINEAWISPEVDKVFEPRADMGFNHEQWLRSLRSCINYYKSLK